MTAPDETRNCLVDVDTAGLRGVAMDLAEAARGLARHAVERACAVGPGVEAVGAAPLALARTQTDWVAYLAALGEAVTAAAADLTAVADGYAGAEEEAGTHFAASREAGGRPWLR